MKLATGAKSGARRPARCMLLLALLPVLCAAQEKLTFAIPGIPPVFAGALTLVADKEGFFKKRGVDVTVRAFETGAAASRAVATGEVSLAFAPTPLLVTQMANSDVKLVGVYGLEHPDWLIGSTDPNASCDTLKGAAVGVDAVGGARSLALQTLLVGGCKLKLEDVQQVALSSNVGPAMVAGQLKYGTLHIDDVAVIEAETKKPVKTVVSQKSSRPIDHYMTIVANRDKLGQNRDAYVRAIAALIDAQRFMRDPANAAKVAQIVAAPMGRTPAAAERALKAYLDMEFWPNGSDGLAQKNFDAMGQAQKRVGNIKADREPAPYEKMVDSSIWRDANAMASR